MGYQMNKVIFLAHGGMSVGMGHVVRSLSLANEFRTSNYEVIFISKYEEGQRIIKQYHFKLRAILAQKVSKDSFEYGKKSEQREDLENIKEILKEEVPEILVIDTYNVSEDFFIELKKLVKILIYIDDLNMFPYPVDVVINGNITAQDYKYQKVFPEQKFLLGLSYNLIRDEFKNIKKRKNIDNRKIMLTTGASDPYNMTQIILEYLMAYKDFSRYEICVIIGNSFQEKNVNNIKEVTSQLSNIKIYENVSNMCDIMMDCTYAISAGGSTLYELFRCGVLTLAFIYADNQKKIVEKAKSKGLLFNLGYFNLLNKEKIINMLESMIFYNSKEFMLKKIQSAVDCKGTKRIVENVNAMLETKKL